jgi:uncharacterized membrane protein (DUF4010 family)
LPEAADALIGLRNLAVALAIGFLIGFEREHTHAVEARTHTFAGARTFALVGFIGGLAGWLDRGFLLPGVALAFIGALTVASYWASARDEAGRGGTTEIALAVTFLLGLAAARDQLLIAATGGVAVAILLSIKESVVRWASALTGAELYAALRLLAISVIVLPLLPDRGYGPYEALNPREIWLMVVFISALSFFGYWLIKLMGGEKGLLLTGLAGGLASSTATTLSLARFARDGASPKQVAAGIVAANVVMLARVGFLLAAVARDVLAAVWPVLAAGAVVGAGAALILWRGSREKRGADDVLTLGNPMEIKPALIFAVLLAVIALASRFGADQFGQGGLFVVGLISGLADVDAMTLSAGRQAAGGGVEIAAAGAAIMAAVASNIVVKGAMTWGIGGRAAGMIVAAVFAAIIAAGVAAFLFV